MSSVPGICSVHQQSIVQTSLIHVAPAKCCLGCFWMFGRGVRGHLQVQEIEDCNGRVIEAGALAIAPYRAVGSTD